MFPGKEFLGNPPRCEMERYFCAGRTNEVQTRVSQTQTSQLNHRSSDDDGESPEGVITILMADVTAIINTARDSPAILPQRRAATMVPPFLCRLSIKTYSPGRFWSHSA